MCIGFHSCKRTIENGNPEKFLKNTSFPGLKGGSMNKLFNPEILHFTLWNLKLNHFLF
jgi:hypothetical protein